MIFAFDEQPEKENLKDHPEVSHGISPSSSNAQLQGIQQLQLLSIVPRVQDVPRPRGTCWVNKPGMFKHCVAVPDEMVKAMCHRSCSREFEG